MKEIIYLDTDFLHSLLAQKNNGLPTSTDRENQEESKQDFQQTAGKDSSSFTELEGKSGKISIPAIVESPEGEIRIHVEPGKYSSESSFWTESEIGKEIISKQLHDDALDEFEQHLKENELITQKNTVERLDEYIEVYSSFELIDLNLLESAFSETMVDIMLVEGEKEKNNELEEINQATDIDKNERKRRRDDVTQVYQKYEQQLRKEFQEYSKMLGLLKKFLPSSVFIKAGNMLAPLKENFLREERNQILFKYGNKSDGNKVKIIAKSTRQMKKSEIINSQSYQSSSFIDAFHDFNGLVDEIMVNNLELINDGDYVVNPIAIYFE